MDFVPGPPSPSRELVPYPLSSREILSRYKSSIVVYNSDSKQLSVESTEQQKCPLCQRPYFGEGVAEDDANGHDETPFVSPGYFRRLAHSRVASNESSARSSRPTSPRLRLPGPERLPTPNGTALAVPEPGEAPALFRHRASVVARPSNRPFVPRATVEDDLHESGSNGLIPPLQSPFDGRPDLKPTESFGDEILEPARTPDDRGVPLFQEEPIDDELKGEAAEKFFGSFFQVERVLGRGGKGTVLLVRNKVLGSSLGRFACKRIPVGDDKAWTNNVMKELRPLEGVQHRNLVTHFFAWSANYQASLFAPKIPHLYILQQYCNGGTLYDYIRRFEELEEPIRRRPERRGSIRQPQADRRLTLQEIGSFFRDIVAGIAYLHSRDLVHRDLKPQNCLLHSEGNNIRALVSDFGETRGTNVPRDALATGYTGTMAYAAPETVSLNQNGKYGDFTQKSDLFSLGMILYFMCFGELPYENCDGGEDEGDIDAIRAEVSSWPGFENRFIRRVDLPDQLYMYLGRLLSKDPEKRPSAANLLQSLDRDFNMYGRATSPISGVTSQFRGNGSPGQSRSPLGEGSAVRTDSRASARGMGQALTHRDSMRDQHGKPFGGTAMVRGSSGPGSSSMGGVAAADATVKSAAAAVGNDAGPRLLPAPHYSVRQRMHMRLARVEESFNFRMAVFLLKVWSVTAPCSPAATNTWLLLPLMAVAAIDLVRDSLETAHATSALLVLHCAVLWTAQHFHRLCDAGLHGGRLR